MTVESNILKSGPYNTDGTTTSFPATFQYLEDSDIVVTLLNTTTGVTLVGVLNTDYTVVDNTSPTIGGTVTIAAYAFSSIANAAGIIPAGYTITLNPSIPQLQQESYPNAGLFPSAAIEQALDRLTLIAQELQLGANQALKVPVTDSSAISTIIPNSTLRINGGLGSYLFFSGATGAPGVSSGVSSVAVSAAMSPVVQASTTALAAEILLEGNIANIANAITDTNYWWQFTYSVNSYAQAIWQNTSNGATASTDLVVCNNFGTATTYYGNFGMNSSGFTGSGSFNLANAVYLTSTSGDLAIGTTTANAIHFVVNNGATDAMTISSSGAVSVPGALSATTSLKLNGSPVFDKIVVQKFTSSGTYTPTTGMVYATIECWGGGAGGGGITGASSLWAGSGGGGAGGYSRSTKTAATIGSSQTVTIGAAGAAGTAGNTGGNGGASSVGSLCVSNGGGGGSSSLIGGLGGGAGTGDIASPGMAGGTVFSASASQYGAAGGAGGSTLVGAGGLGSFANGVVTAAGNAGLGYGAGGSGASTSNNSGGSQPGGAGTQGLVIITEYVSI